MRPGKRLELARKRLVETGGRTSSDLGLGRIVGQVLVYLYLQPGACALEDLENDLGLSKASVSVAARQLEQLGLTHRVWIQGERKKYYRSAENIAQALQQGLLSTVRQKLQLFGIELDAVLGLIDDVENKDTCDVEFLIQRVTRAKKLQSRLDKVLGNPIVSLLTQATRK